MYALLTMSMNNTGIEPCQEGPKSASIAIVAHIYSLHLMDLSNPSKPRSDYVLFGSRAVEPHGQL